MGKSSGGIRGGMRPKKSIKNQIDKIKVYDFKQSFRGDSEANWVKVSINLKNGETVIIGRAVALSGTREKAINDAIDAATKKYKL